MATFKAVVEKLSADPAVWSRTQSELSAADDKQERLIALAKEQGLALDPGEIERVVRQASRELSEGELESVAGGFGTQTLTTSQEQSVIGMLVPAVQKVRDY